MWLPGRHACPMLWLQLSGTGWGMLARAANATSTSTGNPSSAVLVKKPA